MADSNKPKTDTGKKGLDSNRPKTDSGKKGLDGNRPKTPEAVKTNSDAGIKAGG